MTAVRIELPPKLIPVFDGEADYRGAHGGRGSAKTRSFALMFAVRGYIFGMEGRQGLLLGCREFMNSLDDSSLQEIKDAILSIDQDEDSPTFGEYLYPWLVDYYEIGEKYIRSRDGNIRMAFSGLRHNLDSIKGKSKILIAWADEAETISSIAWDKLDSTIREDGSELWVTWNPESEDSETKRRFQDNPPPGAKIVEINWRDNPWFPARLNRRRLHMLETDPDRYDHEWEGKCLTRSDAQILKGKWAVRDFEPGKDWHGPYYGLDFGFSVDPTAAVKCWIYDQRLWIEHEAGKVNLELDDTAEFLRERIPGITEDRVRADSSRPESISFLRRHGMPGVYGVHKAKGGEKDGINYLRSFREIVIHTRCEAVQREARLWSYKIDKQSNEVTTTVLDLNNHYWDATRYALEPMISAGLQGYDAPIEPEPNLLEEYEDEIPDDDSDEWRLA